MLCVQRVELYVIPWDWGEGRGEACMQCTYHGGADLGGFSTDLGGFSTDLRGFLHSKYSEELKFKEQRKCARCG